MVDTVQRDSEPVDGVGSEVSGADARARTSGGKEEEDVEEEEEEEEAEEEEEDEEGYLSDLFTRVSLHRVGTPRQEIRAGTENTFPYWKHFSLLHVPTPCLREQP